MKRLIILSIIIMIFIPWGVSAHAADTPHIIISGEVWMLDDNSEKLFLLPDSYYARINNIDEQYYYISFNGVNGKVSKNVVSATGYHTQAKGTTMTLGISDAYLEFVAINLKRLPDLSSENVIELPTYEVFTFIGEYPTVSDGIWYYVKYDRFYGYIKNQRTSMPDIVYETFVPEVNNQTEPPILTDDNGQTDGLLDGLDGKQLRIIIIIGLAIPAILIVFLLFRPSKNRKYYD